MAKWPFYLGDAVMLGMAGFVFLRSHVPMQLWEGVTFAGCVLLGAVLGILPHLLEHQRVLKTIQTRELAAAIEKIRNLDAVAAQVSSATNNWQLAQDQSERAVKAAREISEHMTTELKEFRKFMEQINDNEKRELRLEVEKLHRAESDWLQVMVRVFDHIFALHLGATRSGQPALISQIGTFQNACRDAARRVGLVPLVAETNETFDPKRHQAVDGDSPTAGTAIQETIATGYSFQSRLVRPVLVRLGTEPFTPPTSPAADTVTTTGNTQEQLPLDQAGPA